MPTRKRLVLHGTVTKVFDLDHVQLDSDGPGRRIVLVNNQYVEVEGNVRVKVSPHAGDPLSLRTGELPKAKVQLYLSGGEIDYVSEGDQVRVDVYRVLKEGE